MTYSVTTPKSTCLTPSKYDVVTSLKERRSEEPTTMLSPWTAKKKNTVGIHDTAYESITK